MKLNNEIWKDIPEYEGLYQVSNLGNVKSIFRYKKLLKKFYDKDGYELVNLYKNKKIAQKRVHRLVAQAFIPNPNNYPQINHKDENKQNNIVDNLEWITLIDNCNYGTRNQKISKKVNQYDLQGNLIKKWNSIIQVEKELNIFHSRIVEVCKGRRKQIGGYKWKYENETI